MVKVKYLGRAPEYLEGFPEDCKRSVVGSIHLTKGCLKKMTVQEYEFVKKNNPAVAKLLTVIEVIKKVEPKAEKPAVTDKPELKPEKVKVKVQGKKKK